MAFNKILVSSPKIQKEVKTGWILEATKYNRKHYALFNAVKSKCASTVEIIISEGVNVDGRMHKGTTAVHLAAKLNCADIVEVLIDNGADVNIPDGECITPLMCAIKKKHNEIVEQLLNAGAELLRSDGLGNTVLHYAARYSPRSAELMLSKGADVNVIGQCDKIKERRSPLMVAAAVGNLTTLLLLLNKGADVCLRSGHIQTALHFAQSDRVVEILWEWGADIYAWDMDGNTPLHSAMKRRNDKVAEALLTLGPPSSDYGRFVYRSDIISYSNVKELMTKFRQACYNGVTFRPRALFTDDYGFLDTDFASQCSMEVQRMKEARFGKLSLFHVLVGGLTDCTFATNAKICETIEKEQFEHDFPLYHTILRRHLRLAKRRNNVVCGSLDKFACLVENFQRVRLPEEVCHIILSQLSTADLIRFNRAVDSAFVIHEAEDHVYNC